MPTFRIQVKDFQLGKSDQINKSIIVDHTTINIDKKGNGIIEIPSANEERARHFAQMHIDQHR